MLAVRRSLNRCKGQVAECKIVCHDGNHTICICIARGFNFNLTPTVESSSIKICIAIVREQQGAIIVVGICCTLILCNTASCSSNYNVLIVLCVSNEIIEEYLEVLSRNINPWVAESIIYAILTRKNVKKLVPYYHFGLIEADPDDNKFVDCAIAANAKYIVSEDHHFDVLQSCSFPKVDVIGLDLFANLLKSKPYIFFEDDTTSRLNEPAVDYNR